jgi:hypothetical protein
MDVLLTIHVINISYIIASCHVLYVKETLHENIVNENKCMTKNSFHMKFTI